MVKLSLNLRRRAAQNAVHGNNVHTLNSVNEQTTSKNIFDTKKIHRISHHLNKKKIIIVCCFGVLIVSCYVFMANHDFSLVSIDSDNQSKSVHGINSSSVRPLECTRYQLLKERDQLQPSMVAFKSPSHQSSFITQKTKCPDSSNWLEEYYQELQGEHSQDLPPLPPFIGMSIGCNKGFDALNTLRMGTFNAKLSKSAWNKAMAIGGKIDHSVCKQNETSVFDVDDHKSAENARPGEIHCFEPMPVTVSKLKHAATSLGYDKMGYKVVHAGVGKTSGMAWFPSKSLVKGGVENKGMFNCDQRKGSNHCDRVDVFSLQNYVTDHLDGTGPIQILQIDVEGNDAEVLLGASSKVLERVEYLEFEYNHMGMWKNQHLYDIVEMLDHNDFTCYWSGVKMLWRITGCWMIHFDVHVWSNIACVNRRRVPKLASKMESVFLQTLEEPFANDWHGRFTRWDDYERRLQMEFKDDQIISTDPDVMSRKYLLTRDQRLALLTPEERKKWEMKK